MGYKLVNAAEKRKKKNSNRGSRNTIVSKTQQAIQLSLRVKELTAENEAIRTRCSNIETDLHNKTLEIQRWRNQSFILNPEGLTLHDRGEFTDTSEAEILVGKDGNVAVNSTFKSEDMLIAGRQYGSSVSVALESMTNV